MEVEEQEYSMIEQRYELMVPTNSGSSSTLRQAYFLKPIISSPNFNQIQPKLPSFASSIPNLKLVKKRIKFKVNSKPLQHWNSWVEDLQQTHQGLWKKVGIFDAIKGTAYNIVRDKELVMRLAEKWCSETNTFVFSWGECSITLEDVMVLGGFPVSGLSSRSQFEGGEMLEKLVDSWKLIKKKYKLTRVCRTRWLNYFKGRGGGVGGGELEHVAFLALWLSRYIFTSNVYPWIRVNVFPIAVSLSKGIRIALAPVILASIYRDLRLLKKKIVTFECQDHQDDGSKLAIRAPFQLVQVWAWERFLTLSPKPIPLACCEPRVARWHGIKRKASKILRLEIGFCVDDFLWRPYALQLKNWEVPKFYCDQEKWVLVDSEIDEQIVSFARCFRACELVGIDCVEQYLPHRVAMQFALDQDIPSPVPRMNADYELAWSSFDKSLDGLKFYIPPRLFEGDMTLQYSEWWRTPLFLRDVVKRKRSTRKLKRLFKVLDADHKGSEHGEDTVINLQAGLENSDKCEGNVLREEVEWRSDISMVEGSKASERIRSPNEFHPTLSSPACFEAMDSEYLGSGSDMLIKITSPFKDIPSDNNEYVDEIVSCSLRNSLTGQKEIKEKNMNGSYLNLGVGGKSSEGKHCPSENHLSLSSPTCNEVLRLDSVKSCSDLPNENSPVCKGGKPSETQEHDTNQNDFVNVMKPRIGVLEDKGQLESNALEKDKEIEVNESYEVMKVMDMGEDTCTGAEPLMGFVINTLSSVLVQDERGKAMEETKSKQVNCSHVNVVNVSDGEDNIGVRDAFEARCLALDAGLSRLKKRVSSLQARKLKSKAG